MARLKLLASIKNLIKRPKKQKGVQKRYPGEYFKSVYLNEQAATGASIIASCSGTSFKAAADALIVSAVSSVGGELLAEHAKIQAENERRGAKGQELIEPSDGIKRLRKYLKDNGTMTDYYIKKYGL